MRFEPAMQVERLMLLVWKTLFGASPLALHDHSPQNVKKHALPLRGPETPSDAAAERLWNEWLEDDDWRVGKP